jgi:hypothetical protein
MMKTKINRARVFVKANFKSEGSVLRETVKAQGLGFETRLEIDSQEPTERVAAVVRNAENGCYVLQSILNPVPVERTFMLNGTRFNPEALKKGR